MKPFVPNKLNVLIATALFTLPLSANAALDIGTRIINQNEVSPDLMFDVVIKPEGSQSSLTSHFTIPDEAKKEITVNYAYQEVTVIDDVSKSDYEYWLAVHINQNKVFRDANIKAGVKDSNGNITPIKGGDNKVYGADQLELVHNTSWDKIRNYYNRFWKGEERWVERSRLDPSRQRQKLDYVFIPDTPTFDDFVNIGQNNITKFNYHSFVNTPYLEYLQSRVNLNVGSAGFQKPLWDYHKISPNFNGINSRPIDDAFNKDKAWRDAILNSNSSAIRYSYEQNRDEFVVNANDLDKVLKKVNWLHEIDSVLGPQTDHIASKHHIFFKQVKDSTFTNTQLYEVVEPHLNLSIDYLKDAFGAETFGKYYTGPVPTLYYNEGVGLLSRDDSQSYPDHLEWKLYEIFALSGTGHPVDFSFEQMAGLGFFANDTWNTAEKFGFDEKMASEVAQSLVKSYFNRYVDKGQLYTGEIARNIGNIFAYTIMQNNENLSDDDKYTFGNIPKKSDYQSLGLLPDFNTDLLGHHNDESLIKHINTFVRRQNLTYDKIDLLGDAVQELLLAEIKVNQGANTTQMNKIYLDKLVSLGFLTDDIYAIIDPDPSSRGPMSRHYLMLEINYFLHKALTSGVALTPGVMAQIGDLAVYNYVSNVPDMPEGWDPGLFAGLGKINKYHHKSIVTPQHFVTIGWITQEEADNPDHPVHDKIDDMWQAQLTIPDIGKGFSLARVEFDGSQTLAQLIENPAANVELSMEALYLNGFFKNDTWKSLNASDKDEMETLLLDVIKQVISDGKDIHQNDIKSSIVDIVAYTALDKNASYTFAAEPNGQTLYNLGLISEEIRDNSAFPLQDMLDDLKGNALDYAGLSSVANQAITAYERTVLTLKQDVLFISVLDERLTDGVASEALFSAQVNSALNGQGEDVTDQLQIQHDVEPMVGTYNVDLYTEHSEVKNLTVHVIDVLHLNADGMFTPFDTLQTQEKPAMGNNALTVTYEQATDQALLKSGHHKITMHVHDGETLVGSMERDVYVHPSISFSTDAVLHATTNEKVSVILNGESPVYPLEIRFDAIAMKNGAVYPMFVEIEEGSLVTHDLSEIDIPTDDEISFQVSSVVHKVSNDDAQTSVTIQSNSTSHKVPFNTDSSIVPSHDIDAVIHDDNGDEMTLAYVSDTGDLLKPLTLKANVTNSSNVENRWTHEYTPFNSTSGAQFNGVIATSANHTLSGTNLEEGTHIFHLESKVVVTSCDVEANTCHQNSLTLIVKKAPTLEATLDSDGDGIPDAEEGFADSDGDHIPDYLDDNDICEVQSLGNGAQIQSSAGSCIKLGQWSAEMDTHKLHLTGADLPESRQDSTNPDFAKAKIMNFYIDDVKGDHSTFVVKLDTALTANSTFRKYTKGEGAWFTFNPADGESIKSAKAVNGVCPDTAEYRDGLNDGDDCVELTIEDGGTNDFDGMKNGRVVDPGYFTSSVKDAGTGDDTGTNTDTAVTTDSGGSSMNPMSLLLILLSGFGLIIRRAVRVKK